MDVRARIADAAGVSTGNVTKVKHLVSAAYPEVLDALRNNEVSIHQASLWLRKPHKQLESLRLRQNRRRISTTVDTLLRAHRDGARDNQLDLKRIAAVIAKLHPDQSDSILLGEVRLYIVVVQHTFGGRLNQNPHLHIMVSAGGLRESDGTWVHPIEFDQEQIIDLWRFAVTSYLWKANRDVLLRSSVTPARFSDLILAQTGRRWNIHITRQMTKHHFLGYAGRYIRRLPISQKRILCVAPKKVVYQSKETRTKTLLERSCAPAEFVALLSQHVPDRYRHSMRYVGLMAPRTKRTTSAAVFLLLGQKQRSRPPRLSWRNSLIRNFQTDPLRDSHGKAMSWVRRISLGVV